MDNPFDTIILHIARLQESVDFLLSEKSGNKPAAVQSATKDITFNRKELSAYLRCSLATVDRYKRDGVIPYIQAGRTLLFQKEAVDKALASDAKKKGVKPNG